MREARVQVYFEISVHDVLVVNGFHSSKYLLHNIVTRGIAVQRLSI